MTTFHDRENNGEDVVNNNDEVENDDGSSAGEVEDVTSNPQNEVRVRWSPYWMREYETGEGLSEEEDEANLTLFTSAGRWIIHDVQLRQ